MLEILRDPAWQGISGIIASISLILFVFVERRKIDFPNVSVNFRRLVLIGLLALFSGAFAMLLGALALATTDAFVSRFGYFVGGLLAYVSMGTAVGFWLVLLIHIFIDKILHDPKLVSFILMGFMVSAGIYHGLLNSTTDTQQLIQKVFYYGLGLWESGPAIIVLIRLDSEIRKLRTNQNAARSSER